MKKLYTNSLSKLLTELSFTKGQRLTLQIISELLIKKELNLKVKSLVRLPNNELRTVLKIPCPINSANQNEIQIFKQLRNGSKIKEENVCQKCPKSARCLVNGMPPKESKNPKLQDLLYFVIMLNQCKQSEFSQLRWAAGYKVLESLRILVRDPHLIKKQALIYEAFNSQTIQEVKIEKRKEQKEDIFRERRFHLQNKQSKEN